MKPVYFAEKDPEAVVPVEFDFTTPLGAAAIQGLPVVTIAVVSGVDAAANDMLNGAAAAVGGKVTQSVRQGVANADYRLKCKVATNDARTLTLARILPVRNA